MAQRVPIEGEAGFGYVLDPRYDMPPLMLTPDEIEAVVLGVQMVARLNDAAMRNAASDVMAKITSVMPQDLLPYLAQPAVSIKPEDVSGDVTRDTRPLRLAIREGRKLELDYRAADGAVTSRIVWPVLLGCADAHCLLIAWCQSKQGASGISAPNASSQSDTDESIGMSKSKLRQQWQQWRDAEMRQPRGAQ